MISKILLSVLFVLPAVAGYAQEKSVDISLIQGANKYALDRPEIELQRKAFTIEVTLNNIDGVYLYADFADSLYRLNDDDPIPGFENLPSMSMAEESFNKDQEMIISKTGWAFWFYDKKLDWHRFDKDIKTVNEHTVIAHKTVKQFYFPPTEQTLPIAGVQLPLYLFFVAADTDKDGNAVKALQRFKVKINWK